MDETWLTQSEVMQLTGRTQRWAQKHRDRLGYRPGEASSNGKPEPLYALSCLPVEAQQKWARKQRVIPIEFEPAKSPGQHALDLMAPGGSQMSDEDRAVAEERFRVIAPLIEPTRYRSIWIGRTKDQVVELLSESNTRTLKTSGRKVPISKRTIYNWVARWEGKRDGRRGLQALVDQDRCTKGQAKKFNQAALDLVVKLMTPKPGADGYGEMTVWDAFSAYHEELTRRQALDGQPLAGDDAKRLRNYLDSDGRLLPEAQLSPVTYETFRRLVRSLPQPLLTLARKGRENFDAVEVPYSYRALSKLEPLDWVVMDHRQLDLFCLLPDRKGWKIGRPWVTAALDMRTRRWLSWVIVAQPDSQSIATSMKRLLLEHGRPRAFYWDNGQDFECDWLDGVLQSLKIKVTHSIVKRARSKIIEPNFRRLSNFERTLPWWTGHKTAARPDERLGKLYKQHDRWLVDAKVERPFRTIDEISTLYDQLFADLNSKPLEGEGMQVVSADGLSYQSPEEAWNSLAGDVTREAVDRATLLFMFRDRRKVKVAHGQIRLSYHGSQFIYEPSSDDAPLALAPFNGKSVEVALDKLDLQTVAVFYEDKLVCLADNMELRGMREDAFKEDEKVRRRMYRWFKSLIDAAHQQLDVPTPIEALERRVREAQELPEPERKTVNMIYPQVGQAVAAMGSRERFSFAQGGEIRSAEAEDDSGTEFEFFGD